jgi:hypothetical protein
LGATLNERGMEWSSCACPLCGAYRKRSAAALVALREALETKLARRRASCEATLRALREKRDAQDRDVRARCAALVGEYELEARAIDAAMHAEVARLVEQCGVVQCTVNLVVEAGLTS